MSNKKWVIAAVEWATVRPPKWMSYDVTYRSKLTGQEFKNWCFDCVHCTLEGFRKGILTQDRHQYFEMAFTIIRYNLEIRVEETKEHFIFHSDGDYLAYQEMLNPPAKLGRSSRRGRRGRPKEVLSL